MNMILGDVEEVITSTETDEETFEEFTKTTKSVLDRGAVLLKSAYDAQRAEQLATQPPGKAFTVAEYLAEFVAPT